MSTAERTFQPFPRLPLELREQIWRYCIPSRVRELDTPLTDNVYWDQPQPCQLQHTSSQNSRPPLITYVCRESRQVAHETGLLHTLAESAEWYTATAIYETWQNPMRESLHLNWAQVYAADFHSQGNPLEHLVNVGQDRKVSITAEYLFQNDSTRDQDRVFLKRFSSWQVVVHTIVVHSSIRSAAATGLFGLSGDSRVQILDVGDFADVKRYLDLAEACESGRDITTRQDFRPTTIWSAAERLRKHVLDVYGSEMTTRIRPAVMFRLCTQMCNDRTVEVRRKRASWLPRRFIRGRGRGRGR